jgi:hypothetical protein
MSSRGVWFYKRYMEFNSFIRYQNYTFGIYDLFKINNFVAGGKEIVKSLYNSLEKTQRETVYCGNSEQAGSPFIIVKIDGLGDLLVQLIWYTSTAFGHFKSCWERYHISHASTLREKNQ